MQSFVCLYDQPGGHVGAVPLVEAGDCPGLVVSQAMGPALLAPSLMLALVLAGALVALSVVRHRYG
jgi:hypothetical protein